MMTSLPIDIETNLPYLRRYARAMTGSRSRGDTLAEAVLIKFLSGTLEMDGQLSPRIVMFRILQDLWNAQRSVFADDLSDIEARAQMHLAKLAPGSREALLLRAFEQFSDEEIATIMREHPGKVAELVRIARLDLAKSISGRVLVIEDEAAIAAEIEGIITEMGHSVIGNAQTSQDAVRLANFDEPDLILSDIQLAQNTSGLDAVSEILVDYPKKPVVFITAFPEKLLTGVEREPAFLITKPYTVDQIRSAVSQAMFFAPQAT